MFVSYLYPGSDLGSKEETLPQKPPITGGCHPPPRCCTALCSSSPIIHSAFPFQCTLPFPSATLSFAPRMRHTARCTLHSTLHHVLHCMYFNPLYNATLHFAKTTTQSAVLCQMHTVHPLRKWGDVFLATSISL